MKKEKFTVLAKTLGGLEDELAKELLELGANEPKTGKRAVTFQADNPLLYKVNLWSRLALRFFKQIHAFKISKADDVYEGMNSIKWYKLIGVDQTFRIDNTITSPFFQNPLYAAHLAKDAIVDQFRSNFNKRPSVDKTEPDFTLLLAIKKDFCTVYLDSSGDALFKRGYRINTVAAPINEVLAAGILRISKWNVSTPLIDPMCGSGTFPVEAALMALNIPPTFNRKSFAFEKWPDFDRMKWKKIQSEVFDKQKDVNMKIYGYDISDSNLAVAKNNIEKIRLHKDIKLARSDFLKLMPPVKNGVVIINPPYGERLKENETISLYRGIGDHLKRNFQGFTAYIISSDLKALKNIALKPKIKKILFNGKLECKLLGFDLFDGNWKSMKIDKASKFDE